MTSPFGGVDGSVLAETDTSGNTVNEYVFFDGMRVARRDSSGNVYYYFGNVLGSAAITTATGSLCYDADFYPFGGEITFTNTCAQNYKFAGMEQDPSSGNYRTMFRQYSSDYGRWLSPDPYNGSYDINDPQSMNRYSYVMNNPTSFVDPLGLDGCGAEGEQYCPWEYYGDYYYDESESDEQATIDYFYSYFYYAQTGLPTPVGPAVDFSLEWFPDYLDLECGSGMYCGNAMNIAGGSGGGAPNNAPKQNPFLCGSEAAGKISLAGGLSHISLASRVGLAGSSQMPSAATPLAEQLT